MSVETGTIVRVSKWGNSYAIVLPVRLAEALGIAPGSKVAWSVRTKDSLILNRVEPEE